MKQRIFLFFLVYMIFPITGVFAGQLEDRISALEALIAAQQGQINSLQATVSDQQARLTGFENNPAVIAGSSGYIRVDMDTINGVVGPHVILEGVNVHVRSGSGSTNDGYFAPGYGAVPAYTGLGNIIIGYNETPEMESPMNFPPLVPNERKGSHNLILGQANRFESYGSIISGWHNSIKDGYSYHSAAIAGGNNEVSSIYGGAFSGSSNKVVGGQNNVAIGGGDNYVQSAINGTAVGGAQNRIDGQHSIISGGWSNKTSASAIFSAVFGGQRNEAIGQASAVSGGQQNAAIGNYSSVSGGLNRQALGEHDWAAGNLWENY